MGVLTTPRVVALTAAPLIGWAAVSFIPADPFWWRAGFLLLMPFVSLVGVAATSGRYSVAGIAGFVLSGAAAAAWWPFTPAPSSTVVGWVLVVAAVLWWGPFVPDAAAAAREWRANRYDDDLDDSDLVYDGDDLDNGDRPHDVAAAVATGGDRAWSLTVREAPPDGIEIGGGDDAFDYEPDPPVIRTPPPGWEPRSRTVAGAPLFVDLVTGDDGPDGSKPGVREQLTEGWPGDAKALHLDEVAAILDVPESGVRDVLTDAGVPVTARVGKRRNGQSISRAGVRRSDLDGAAAAPSGGSQHDPPLTTPSTTA